MYLGCKKCGDIDMGKQDVALPPDWKTKNRVLGLNPSQMWWSSIIWEKQTNQNYIPQEIMSYVNSGNNSDPWSYSSDFMRTALLVSLHMKDFPPGCESVHQWMFSVSDALLTSVKHLTPARIRWQTRVLSWRRKANTDRMSQIKAVRVSQF
jgi:hypothetical protein